MALPRHWPRLADVLRGEPWFGDLDSRVARGEEPSSFFERQLISDDYGEALATWLEWATSIGSARRFVQRVRPLRARRDPAPGEQYQWRQVCDELQVGYLLSRGTSLCMAAAEPQGRDGRVLDWGADAPSGDHVGVEVKSLFTDGWARDSDATMKLNDMSAVLDGPFRIARRQFDDSTRNLCALVVHEPTPDAGDVMQFLFGPVVTQVTLAGAGRPILRDGIDGSPRSTTPGGRPRSMYAHFNRRDNRRVGAVAFVHSRPDGRASLVVFHNPWARSKCCVAPAWLEGCCQVQATIDGGTIRFTVQGSWPPDLHRPHLLPRL
jgi:hypothetical protein